MARPFALTLALTVGTFGLAQSPAPFDLLIVNGRVLDGSGDPWVGLTSGFVAAESPRWGIWTAPQPRARSTPADASFRQGSSTSIRTRGKGSSQG